MSEKDNKKLQSYLDNIQAKTGKTPDDFRQLAAKKGIEKPREFLIWLKQDFGLGYGHAGAIWHVLAHEDDINATTDTRLDKLFSGSKAKWRKAYDALAAKIGKFGEDVELSPNMTYVNVLRGGKKFAIVQPSSAERLDIGIKRKGVAPSKRFEAAGSWNSMVTHRVRITDPKQIDRELLAWLKEAYDESTRI
ncbi:MAG TPA: DUF5655 domain-containing protein [Anaerolineae bacterium]|nr:DUF5655 domain-containing protein [Anaerolineae bacterium]